MLLRRAKPEDALNVARVHVRAWQIAYRGLLPDAYLDGLIAEERAARYTFGEIDVLKPTTIVAVEDASVCGFATVGPARDSDAPAAGEVSALHVAPEWWGKGVGRLLITAARDILHQQGYKNAVLWVLSGNVRAERFYIADGWQPDGKRRIETVWAVSASERRYHRDLP